MLRFELNLETLKSIVEKEYARVVNFTEVLDSIFNHTFREYEGNFRVIIETIKANFYADIGEDFGTTIAKDFIGNNEYQLNEVLDLKEKKILTHRINVYLYKKYIIDVFNQKLELRNGGNHIIEWGNLYIENFNRENYRYLNGDSVQFQQEINDDIYNILLEVYTHSNYVDEYFDKYKSPTNLLHQSQKNHLKCLIEITILKDILEIPSNHLIKAKIDFEPFLKKVLLNEEFKERTFKAYIEEYVQHRNFKSEFSIEGIEDAISYYMFNEEIPQELKNRIEVNCMNNVALHPTKEISFISIKQKVDTLFVTNIIEEIYNINNNEPNEIYTTFLDNLNNAKIYLEDLNLLLQNTSILEFLDKYKRNTIKLIPSEFISNLKYTIDSKLEYVNDNSLLEVQGLKRAKINKYVVKLNEIRNELTSKNLMEYLNSSKWTGSFSVYNRGISIDLSIFNKESVAEKIKNRDLKLKELLIFVNSWLDIIELNKNYTNTFKNICYNVLLNKFYTSYFHQEILKDYLYTNTKYLLKYMEYTSAPIMDISKIDVDISEFINSGEIVYTGILENAITYLEPTLNNIIDNISTLRLNDINTFKFENTFEKITQFDYQQMFDEIQAIEFEGFKNADDTILNAMGSLTNKYGFNVYSNTYKSIVLVLQGVETSFITEYNAQKNEEYELFSQTLLEDFSEWELFRTAYHNTSEDLCLENIPNEISHALRNSKNVHLKLDYLNKYSPSKLKVNSNYILNHIFSERSILKLILELISIFETELSLLPKVDNLLEGSSSKDLFEKAILSNLEQNSQSTLLKAIITSVKKEYRFDIEVIKTHPVVIKKFPAIIEELIYSNLTLDFLNKPDSDYAYSLIETTIKQELERNPEIISNLPLKDKVSLYADLAETILNEGSISNLYTFKRDKFDNRHELFIFPKTKLLAIKYIQEITEQILSTYGIEFKFERPLDNVVLEEAVPSLEEPLEETKVKVQFIVDALLSSEKGENLVEELISNYPNDNLDLNTVKEAVYEYYLENIKGKRFKSLVELINLSGVISDIIIFEKNFNNLLSKLSSQPHKVMQKINSMNVASQLLNNVNQ